MPEQTTTSPLKHDIQIIEDFVRASEQSQMKDADASCLTGLGIVLGFASIFAAPISPLFSAAGIVILFVGMLFYKQAYKNAAAVEVPLTVLNRILISDEEQALAFLFRSYDTGNTSLSDPILRTLAAKLRSELSPSRVIGGITMRERLNNMAGEVLNKAFYRSSGEYGEFALAVVETLVRWEMVEALPSLLADRNTPALNTNAKRLREAISEAVLLLSAKADFGQKPEIPAMLEELYRQNQLIASTGGGDMERWRWIRHALTYLLPTLTKADAGLLTKKNRNRLYNWLKISTDHSYSVTSGRSGSELKQAILLALGNIEDTEAIPAMSDVAYMEAPTDHEQQTRNLARKQRDILLRIKERQEVGSTLLRASASPATPGEQLLRPATPAADTTEPEQLLRPHNG